MSIVKIQPKKFWNNQATAPTHIKALLPPQHQVSSPNELEKAIKTKREKTMYHSGNLGELKTIIEAIKADLQALIRLFPQHEKENAWKDKLEITNTELEMINIQQEMNNLQ